MTQQRVKHSPEYYLLSLHTLEFEEEVDVEFFSWKLFLNPQLFNDYKMMGSCASIDEVIDIIETKKSTSSSDSEPEMVAHEEDKPEPSTETSTTTSTEEQPHEQNPQPQQPKRRGRPATSNNERVEFMTEYVKTHPLISSSINRYYNENPDIHSYFDTPTKFSNFIGKNKETFRLRHPKPFESLNLTTPISNLSEYYRSHQLYTLGTYQQFRNEYLKQQGRN